MRRCELDNGLELAIYLIGGNVFATDDECTHSKASLADMGDLDGFVIECSLHLGAFDVRTGEVVSAPCTKPLRTYPVEVRDGRVWVNTGEV